MERERPHKKQQRTELFFLSLIFLGFWVESPGKHLIVSINTHLVLRAPEWFPGTDLPKSYGSIRELLGFFHWQMGYFVGGAQREEDERDESREIKF